MNRNNTVAIHDMEKALLTIDKTQVERLVKESSAWDSPMICIETLIVPALEELGRKWEQGQIALSQIYMSAKICQNIVDTMLPPGHSERRKKPRIAVVVLEDYHALGKQILYSVLRASGYDVIDYGAGIRVDNLVENVIKDRIEILLISTLMFRAALKSKEAIARIRLQAPGTRVIVGGAPFLFDKNLWKDVGADAMGHSASEGIEIVKKMSER